MKKKAGIYPSAFQKAIVLAALCCLMVLPSFSQVKQNNKNKKIAANTGYAPVNGLKMY